MLHVFLGVFVTTRKNMSQTNILGTRNVEDLN